MQPCPHPAHAPGLELTMSCTPTHTPAQRQYRKMDAAAADLTANQIQQPLHKMSCADY